MPEKSFVTLEQAICPVCGKNHDTGNLLLDQRMRNTFERHTVTHFELCPECKQFQADGYIALVEIDPKRSVFNGDVVKPEDAWRTGRICRVREQVWPSIFNVPPPTKGLAFVEADVIDKLEAMQPPGL